MSFIYLPQKRPYVFSFSLSIATPYKLPLWEKKLKAPTFTLDKKHLFLTSSLEIPLLFAYKSLHLERFFTDFFFGFELKKLCFSEDCTWWVLIAFYPSQGRGTCVRDTHLHSSLCLLVTLFVEITMGFDSYTPTWVLCVFKSSPSCRLPSDFVNF